MSVTVKWHGAKAKSQARKGAVEGLTDAADHLLDKSQGLVPVSPIRGGALKASGAAAVDEGALRAAVSYESARHAIEVHEELQNHHAAGTQAKYLEQPFNSERSEMLKLIAAGVKGKLK